MAEEKKVEIKKVDVVEKTAPVFSNKTVSGVYKIMWQKPNKDRATLVEKVLNYCLKNNIKTAANKTPDLEFVKRQTQLLISDVKIANSKNKKSILKEYEIVESAEAGKENFQLVLKVPKK